MWGTLVLLGIAIKGGIWADSQLLRRIIGQPSFQNAGFDYHVVPVGYYWFVVWRGAGFAVHTMGCIYDSDACASEPQAITSTYGTTVDAYHT